MKKKIEFVVPGKQLHCRVQHRRRWILEELWMVCMFHCLDMDWHCKHLSVRWYEKE